MSDMIERERTRALVQEKFLEAFATFGTITRAAQEVGIHRSTAQDWIKNDIVFSQAFAEALRGYRDTIRNTIHERAVIGTQTPLVARGQLVMDALGNPVMVTRHSDQLLGLLARAYLPEYKASSDDMLNVGISYSANSLIIPDITKLKTEVLEALLIDLERLQDEEVKKVEVTMIAHNHNYTNDSPTE